MRWIAAFFVLVVAGCGAGGGPGAGKGPVKLEAFVGLGGLTNRLAELRPVELGTAEAQAFRSALERAKLTNLDEVRGALSFTPPADRRGFAFAVPGCAEDGAALSVEGGTLTARLTGGENVNCVQANYFLTVFSLDRGSIPPTPTLSTSPR
ncbi:hypothetical protein [Amycolatopsis pittospori]|uniref:hypothetical protein n=1 Tax=Amycolatopsis pittospori TaxID=2749434 RepID=UPI001A9EAF61|nr:hypothetical protein [Amycolatopsis pittospori]